MLLFCRKMAHRYLQKDSEFTSNLRLNTHTFSNQNQNQYQTKTKLNQTKPNRNKQIITQTANNTGGGGGGWWGTSWLWGTTIPTTGPTTSSTEEDEEEEGKAEEEEEEERELKWTPKLWKQLQRECQERMEREKGGGGGGERGGERAKGGGEVVEKALSLFVKEFWVVLLDDSSSFSFSSSFSSSLPVSSSSSPSLSLAPSGVSFEELQKFPFVLSLFCSVVQLKMDMGYRSDSMTVEIGGLYLFKYILKTLIIRYAICRDTHSQPIIHTNLHAHTLKLFLPRIRNPRRSRSNKKQKKKKWRRKRRARKRKNNIPSCGKNNSS